jgi:type IV pilus assembly protein PilW
MFQPSSFVRPSRGFTLIEVLVGLVLGMIGIIIMFQVFQVFEGQRRTTVSGGNAQTSGHIAMYAIERQVRLAGLGLMYIARPGEDEYEGRATCPLGIRTYSASGGGLGWAGAGDRPVVPVLVTDGGAAGADEFTVVFGPSAMAGAPGELRASPVNAFTLGAGVQVASAPFVNATSNPPVNAMFKVGDVVLIAQPVSSITIDQAKHCVRLKISAVESVEVSPGRYQARLRFDAGAGYDENPPAGEYVNFLPAAGYTLDADPRTIITHLGGSLATSRYRLVGQQLLQNDVPVADGVVSMQVQYGIGPRRGELGCMSANLSEPACQVVKAWTSAVLYDGVDWATIGTAPWPATAAERRTRLENIARIKAVRIALVIRSHNLERDPIYGAGLEIAPKGSCTAPGDVVDSGGLKVCAWRDPAGGVAVPLVDLTGTADWDRYRYRVYETVVPLRNVIWSSRGA